MCLPAAAACTPRLTPHCLGLGLREREGVAILLRVGDEVPKRLRVASRVRLRVDNGLSARVRDCVAVRVLVPAAEGVRVGEPKGERAGGVVVGVLVVALDGVTAAVPLGVRDAVGSALRLTVGGCVRVSVRVDVGASVDDIVRLLLTDDVSEEDSDGFIVREADPVEEVDAEEEGVIEAEPDPVGEPVAEADPVGVPVLEPVSVVEGVWERRGNGGRGWRWGVRIWREDSGRSGRDKAAKQEST